MLKYWEEVTVDYDISRYMEYPICNICGIEIDLQENPICEDCMIYLPVSEDQDEA